MAVWGFVRREARGLGRGMLVVGNGSWPGDARCEERGLGWGMLAVRSGGVAGGCSLA